MQNAHIHWQINYKNMKNNVSIIVFLYVMCIVLCYNANVTAQNKTTVFLENAETLSFDQNVRNNAQLLQGNVRFRHDKTLMLCDNAYFYEKTNSLDAFGNVKIIQGDTLFIYGNTLYYNGNTRLAQMRNNVRMINRDAVLTTQKLDYDTYSNIGYYTDFGTLTDKKNVLTSKEGEYLTKQNIIKFKQNVVLKNAEFTLYSDTLHYHTYNSLATIVGPTTIISDSTRIYAEKGWYNTSTEDTKLTKNGKIQHKNGKSIQGDSIFYNKKYATIEAFSNTLLKDSVQQISVLGNYGKYFEQNEKGYVTKKATFREHSTADTLFLSADSLLYESIKGDFSVKAFRNVRFWQTDFQGTCDSLTYNQTDSLLTMYHNPILWNEENQISGKVITLKMTGDKVDHFIVEEDAFILSEENPEEFNQLSGRKIIGYILNDKIRKIEIIGNAQSIYYVKDGESAIGTNRAESALLTIFLNDSNQAEKIVMSPQSGGILYPTFQKNISIIRLSNFLKQNNNRPKNQYDIYTNRE